MPSSAALLTLWAGKVTEGNSPSLCLTGHLLCKAVLEIQELDSGMLSSLGGTLCPAGPAAGTAKEMFGGRFLLGPGAVGVWLQGGHSRAVALGILHRESSCAA